MNLICGLTVCSSKEQNLNKYDKKGISNDMSFYYERNQKYD